MRSVETDSENLFFSFRNFGTDNSVCVYGNRNTTTASQCRGYTESVRVPSYCLIILVVLGMKTVCFFKLSQQPKSSCSSCVYAVWSIARYIVTVAVWTQKNFFPLLTRHQGSQGCQKITFYFLQMKLFSFCAKIAPKRHKLQKPSKLKKKCQKKPCFLRLFRIFFNLGAILAHQTSTGMFSGSWRIFWHPWDPWGRINSGDTRVLRLVLIIFWW